MEVKNPIASPVVELNTIHPSGSIEIENPEVVEDVNIHEDDFIFDSISLHFNLIVFIKQFSAHVILPLCPFFTNLKGQGFIPRTSWIFVQNAGACLAMYTVFITYFMCTKETQKAMAGACWMPLLFFIQHRLIISLKYATLSDSEYAKFMACKDVEQCENYNLQMQLLSSWSDRDETVLDFELGSAAVRIGAQVNELYYNIWDGDPAYIKDGSPVTLRKRSNFHQWNAFIRGSKVIDVNAKPAREFFQNDVGGYSVSVFDVAKAVVRHADSSDANKTIVTVMIYVFVFFNLIIPFIHLGTTNMKITWNAPLICFLYFSTVLNYFFARVCYLILCTAVWDVFRQKNMVVVLHKMLRLSDLSDPEFKFCVTSRKAKHGHDTKMSSVANIMSLSIPRRRHVKTCAVTDDVCVVPAVPVVEFKENLTPNHLLISEFANAVAEDNSIPLIPRVEMNCPHNVVGWTYTRLLIQNFGERFRFRIDMYTGGNIVVIFILMIGSLLHVILSSNRAEAYKNCLFQQIVLCVTLVMAFLLVISVAGSKVNDELALHSRTLGAHLLHLRQRILECSRNESTAQELEVLQAIEDNLESVLDITDINTNLKPYKLFGITCSGSVTASIVSTFVSFYSILLSYSGNANLRKF